MIKSRPYFLPLFTRVRGRGVLGNSHRGPMGGIMLIGGKGRDPPKGKRVGKEVRHVHCTT